MVNHTTDQVLSQIIISLIYLEPKLLTLSFLSATLDSIPGSMLARNLFDCYFQQRLKRQLYGQHLVQVPLSSVSSFHFQNSL